MAVLMAGILDQAAAAHQQQQPVAISSLKPVPEAQLRRLLSNVIIGPECCDLAEEFYAGGRYMHDGEAASPGRYTIASNMVCVTLQGERKASCRLVFIDRTGAAYITYKGRQRAFPLEVRTMKPFR